MKLGVGEREIGIVSRMYQCRDQSVFLCGAESFVKKVEKWKPVFDSVIESEGCSTLEALIVLLNRSKGHADEGMLMHLLTSVACELVEPKYTAKDNTPN